MDYGSGPYTVIFPAGTTRVPFNVSIIDNPMVGDKKYFMLDIDPSSLPTDVTVGDPGQVTVTITDDDSKF